MADGFGIRMRALREARGLSLRDLAERSGVSVPMLSQVERGTTSPTLTTAEKIASGFELTLSTLLRLDEAPPVAVIRAKDRRARERNGHRLEHLSPTAPGERASVTLHSLAAKARTGSVPQHAPGSRETVFVDHGTIDAVVDGRSHTLGTGDTITFDADLEHFFKNTGRGAASFFAVVTSGLRNP